VLNKESKCKLLSGLNERCPNYFKEKSMQAIELPAEIDQNQQIHLQLPQNITAHKARVIIMYEETEQQKKTVTLGLFKDKIQMSDDFNEPLPDSFWLEGQL